MVVLGAVINALLAALGGCLGVFLRRYVTKDLGDFLLVGQGLVCVLLAVQGIMSNSCNISVVTISIACGFFIGHALHIEEHIEKWSERACAYVVAKGAHGQSSQLSQSSQPVQSSQSSLSCQASQSSLPCQASQSSLSYGFIYASVYACTGAMAIMGSLQSGLVLDHTTLIAKGFIDLVVCFALGSVLGIGVPFCGISIFIYEALLSVCASFLSGFLVGDVLAGILIVGSLILLVIGLNLMHITSYKVANMLPSVFLPMIFVPLFSLLSHLV